MGIQHEEVVPASFVDAFSENYLGNPDNVSRLVAEFCSRAEATIIDFMAGRVDKDLFDPAIKNLIHHYADIFSGRRAPEYGFVSGYNDFTLPNKLKADLGDFWRQRRARWDDDAVCVLFEWLTLHLVEAVKKWPDEEDDWVKEIDLKPSIQYAVKVLLGIEERATS